MFISITLATVLGASFLFLLLVWLLCTKLPACVDFKKQYNFAKTLPGPSIWELMRNAKKGRILLWLKELRAQHGKVFRIWFGKDLTVFFSDPDDVKAILSNNQLLEKSHNYRFLHEWLGNGLLTSGGNQWRQRRKLLTPAFHFKILSEFQKPMEENCDILIRKLQAEHLNGEIFDIYPYLTLYAMDIICETAMGIKKHTQMKSESEYVTAVKTMCRISHKQSFSFWNRFAFVFDRTEMGRERNQALKILHSETYRVIELRRKLLEREEIELNGNVEEFGSKRRLAFLDMLLLAQRNGSPLTDSDIREEVDTFMFEGHDTTSSAIGFSIYLLSQHPKVQQAVYEEIESLAGQEQKSMRYLEAVIKESLRLFPAVPFFSRLLLEDLFIDNILIPKGTAVSILTYMVHRNPQIYPDPEVFRPERFLDPETELHPFGFVAFSAGPRNCIGQRFAMLELKCTLSKLLQNFEILPAENYVPEPLAELITKSGNGIKIKLKKRS